MDLSTMMSKIDLHQYETCQEFLDDIDLICRNALEYNPDTDSHSKPQSYIPAYLYNFSFWTSLNFHFSTLGRAIRHRACALKDTAQAIVTTELDMDFEKTCEEIKASRIRRGNYFSCMQFHALLK